MNDMIRELEKLYDYSWDERKAPSDKTLIRELIRVIIKHEKQVLMKKGDE